MTPVVLIERSVQRRNVSWMYTWGSGRTQNVTSRLTHTLSYFCCRQKHIFCGPTTELLALYDDFSELVYEIRIRRETQIGLGSPQHITL